VADGKDLPKGRWSRLAKLAGVSLRAGAGMLVEKDAKTSAERAADVLGQMRGVAAKLGQMASYVDGVIPEAHRESYEKAMKPLLASAARSSPDEVRAIVEEELDAPVSALFSEWDDVPVASASVGQVHAARLPDGRRVAVKVQHPGIVQAMEGDLANAGLVEGVAGAIGAGRFDPKTLIAVVRQRFREELDYGLEADRYERFARLHAGDPVIHVPEVIRARSGKRILTTEFVQGRGFDDVCGAAEGERRRVAETLWRFVYKGICVGGLFNADPHPGNYLFEADGRVAFLDFGCVQPVTGDHLANAQALHKAAMDGDEAEFGPIVTRLVHARPGRLDVRARAYMRHSFEPVFASPFRITRPFVTWMVDEMKSMAVEAARTPEEEFFTMPAESLFMNRLHFGFYSLLARLDVEVDYRAVERAWWAELEATAA
jgi:predicted unusual protein kinase regulating ubiquinone biosynthesis (AarF/ABC1/UbiB family)